MLGPGANRRRLASGDVRSLRGSRAGLEAATRAVQQVALRQEESLRRQGGSATAAASAAAAAAAAAAPDLSGRASTSAAAAAAAATAAAAAAEEAASASAAAAAAAAAAVAASAHPAPPAPEAQATTTILAPHAFIAPEASRWRLRTRAEWEAGGGAARAREEAGLSAPAPAAAAPLPVPKHYFAPQPLQVHLVSFPAERTALLPNLEPAVARRLAAEAEGALHALCHLPSSVRGGEQQQQQQHASRTRVLHSPFPAQLSPQQLYQRLLFSDFCARLLCPDPTLRMSAGEALAHPFLALEEGQGGGQSLSSSRRSCSAPPLQRRTRQ